MSVITIGALKGKFETGDRPYGSDFVDLIDTLGSIIQYDQILGKELAARFKGQELW